MAVKTLLLCAATLLTTSVRADWTYVASNNTAATRNSQGYFFGVTNSTYPISLGVSSFKKLSDADRYPVEVRIDNKKVYHIHMRRADIGLLQGYFESPRMLIDIMNAQSVNITINHASGKEVAVHSMNASYDTISDVLDG